MNLAAARVNANLSTSNFKNYDNDEVAEEDKYSYFMGILRPGQMIKINLSTSLELDDGDLINTKHEVSEGVYSTDFNVDLLSDWNASAVVDLTRLFNVKKSQS